MKARLPFSGPWCWLSYWSSSSLPTQCPLPTHSSQQPALTCTSTHTAISSVEVLSAPPVSRCKMFLFLFPDRYSPPSPMFRTNECESEHFLVLTLDEVVIDHPGRSESPQQSNMALYLVVVVLPTAISMPLWWEQAPSQSYMSVF